MTNQRKNEVDSATNVIEERDSLEKFILSRDTVTEEMEQLKEQLAAIDPATTLAAATLKLDEAAEAAADEGTLQKLALAVQAAANGSDEAGIRRTVLQGKINSLEHKAKALDAHIAQASKENARRRFAKLESLLEREVQAFEKAFNTELNRHFRLAAIDREMCLIKLAEGAIGGTVRTETQDKFFIPVPEGRYLFAAGLYQNSDKCRQYVDHESHVHPKLLQAATDWLAAELNK